jgi:hypothetical protein
MLVKFFWTSQNPRSDDRPSPLGLVGLRLCSSTLSENLVGRGTVINAYEVVLDATAASFSSSYQA